MLSLNKICLLVCESLGYAHHFQAFLCKPEGKNLTFKKNNNNKSCDSYLSHVSKSWGFMKNTNYHETVYNLGLPRMAAEQLVPPSVQIPVQYKSDISKLINRQPAGAVLTEESCLCCSCASHELRFSTALGN